jgi:hypothetical protein
MCFSKRVRASDALILSLSSFRDIVQAVFALSASSSYLRLSGQDILASTEDCIPTKQLLYLPARSQVLSRITRAPNSRSTRIRAIHGAAHHDPQAHASQAATDSASNCASACTIPCPTPDSGSSRSSKATSTTTRYRETSRVWECSAIGCWLSGGVPFADGARHTGSTGRALSCWPSDGSRNRVRSIPFLTLASPPLIRDKNRMR